MSSLHGGGSFGERERERELVNKVTRQVCIKGANE